PLIVYHVLNLVRAGITDIVINHSHLGHMIDEALGDEPFIALSGDIYAPYFDFEQCKDALKDIDAVGQPYPLDQRDIAWVYLTPNPWHNPEGDFGMTMYTLSNAGTPKWNFANIGVYRPEMFEGIKPGEFAKLGPLMRKYIDLGRVGGELYDGPWVNVGTMQQLEELNAPLSARAKK
ncbi:MAG: nucleotidyltransferase family protein, partial [Oxalobacteraceae bacterium]